MIKKTIAIIMFLTSMSICHEQTMHQYITREAWKLLLMNYSFYQLQTCHWWLVTKKQLLVRGNHG